LAVNNSIKVGPLAFLLSMFVITENIMKCPVLKFRNVFVYVMFKKVLGLVLNFCFYF
jgi:hypothetical protein